MKNIHKLVMAAFCAASSLAVQAQAPGTLNILGDNHVIYRLQSKHKFLILPIEEKEENAHLRVIRDNQVVKELNCRLAIDNVDYSVPLELDTHQDSDVLLDITFQSNRRSTGAVKDLAFQVANQLPDNTFLVLGSKHDDKPLLTVMVSKNLIASRQLHAGNLVKEAARLIQGGGGGAPHFATAGGKNTAGLDEAVAKVLELAGF